MGRGRAQMNAEVLNTINGQPSLKHGEITDKILHAFYKVVYPHLGYGFLEKVYENALAIELRKRGLQVEQQKPITVWYHGDTVGEYVCDRNQAFFERPLSHLLSDAWLSAE